MSVAKSELNLHEFDLAESDVNYLTGLTDQLRNPNRKNHVIGKDFIPSSLMTEQQRSEVLGATSYNSIKGNEYYLQQAQGMHLVVHPMDAGLGSSVKRDTYLQRVGPTVGRHLSGLGSKSTDLYFGQFSIAEIKINRIALQSPSYGGVSIAPIVNNDSHAAMASIYEHTSAESRETDNFQSYKDFLLSRNVSLDRWHMQGDLPTLDVEAQAFTKEHTAPGGHGQAGLMVLHEIMNAQDDGIQRIHSIFNGDGPNNGGTPEMIAFTAENAGIVMLTTTKMPSDVKGGLIGGEVHQDGSMTPQILELAQAKNVRQQQEFMDLGLEGTHLPPEMEEQHQPGEQYFNTNIVFMNENVLGPFLRQLRQELGEERFANVLTPELILNRKEKNGKKFDQLEGALGSLILRLNGLVQTDETISKVWDATSGGKKFLQILNTEPENRDETFLPNKFPIDYIMQAFSDHFTLDQNSWVVRNNRPGHLPRLEGDIVQNGTYFSDVQNCIDAFGNVGMLELDHLHIEGPFKFANSKLKGKIRMINESGQLIDLNDPQIKPLLCPDDGNLILGNVEIHVRADQSIEINWL